MNKGVHQIRPPNQPGRYPSKIILIPLTFIGLILCLLGYLFLTTSTHTIKQQIKQDMLVKARSTATMVKENIRANPASLESYVSKQLYSGKEGSIYSVKLDDPSNPASIKGNEGIIDDSATLTAYVPLKELGLGIIARQPLRTAYRPVRLYTVQTIIWLVVFYILIIFAFNIVLRHYPSAGTVKQSAESEIKLTDLNRNLTRLNQLGSEFISVLSRNLRIPLQRIKEGISSLGSLEPKQTERLRRTQTDMDQLTRLIENLSDLAKMETGQIELRRRSVDPSALIRSSISLMESYATSKKVNLITEAPDNLPNVYIDLDRILQILANVVENAIKFSHEGGQVRLSARSLNNKFVQINVTDMGKGFTKEEIARLLPEKSISLSDVSSLGDRTRSIELAIGKRIIELHQGGFWVKSKQGKGTTFSLTLPIAE